MRPMLCPAGSGPGDRGGRGRTILPTRGARAAVGRRLPKYNAAEEGFRIDNTPQWGRFLRPAGDLLLFRTSNPRCRHAWPEVRPDHRPEPRGPSRDRALAALDHRPRWADPSRPCSSLARSGNDLEGHRRAVRHERPARAQMGRAVPTPWAGWPA